MLSRAQHRVVILVGIELIQVPCDSRFVNLDLQLSSSLAGGKPDVNEGQLMRQGPSLTAGFLTTGFARSEKLAYDNLRLTRLTEGARNFDGPDFQPGR